MDGVYNAKINRCARKSFFGGHIGIQDGRNHSEYSQNEAQTVLKQFVLKTWVRCFFVNRFV